MGKAEIIAKYGEEYYERLKQKSRERMYQKYHDDIEAARQRNRDKYAHTSRKAYCALYNKQHAEVYRINARDTNRLKILMHIDLGGKVVHHMKYHADNKDASWIDDIVIMTREEHVKWHRDHPEFVASENIV